MGVRDLRGMPYEEENIPADFILYFSCSVDFDGAFSEKEVGSDTGCEQSECIGNAGGRTSAQSGAYL